VAIDRYLYPDASVMATKLTNQNENAGEEPFELVTFGKGGEFTTLDADKTSALIEQDDLTARELERRWIEFQENPDDGEPWSEVLKSLRTE
jgi:hypothetical protein